MTKAHPLDRVRGHQLLPASVAKTLPALYANENTPDPVAQVKLFSPYSSAVWFLTEYSPEQGLAFGWAALVALAAVLDIAGVVGDLAESMLKRAFGVKDSGWIMPGHGGILDRVDSLLFSGPVLLVVLEVRGLLGG